MNFEFHDNKYCVNCDWLQYSVHLANSEPELICPEHYRIEICQGNNIFEHRAIVYDKRGAKYLTLLWKPYSKVLPSNLMTVQVANEFLYLPHGLSMLWSYDTLREIVDCTFNAVGRVDICIDFEGSDKRNEFLRHLNSGKYYVQAKTEGSSWWHDDGGKKRLHCMTWGSPKSEIKVKVYHKSREQGVIDPTCQPEKPWIVEEWKQREMDITNVWRLEFSLCAAGQLRYNGQPITLENVADRQWLLDVVLSLYHSRFITRMNQGKRFGHRNEDKRLYLLDLPTRPRLLKWAEPQGKDYELPAAIELLRSMMRQIDNPAIMSQRPLFENYATTIADLVASNHLDAYFKRTWENDCDTYLSELYANVGHGLRTATPSPRRLMD